MVGERIDSNESSATRLGGFSGDTVMDNGEAKSCLHWHCRAVVVSEDHAIMVLFFVI